MNRVHDSQSSVHKDWVLPPITPAPTAPPAYPKCTNEFDVPTGHAALPPPPSSFFPLPLSPVPPPLAA